LIALSKVAYDGTAGTATTLYVVTGSNNSPLYATDTSSSTIRVVIENFSCVIDTGDSDEGHFWTYNMNLRETLSRTFWELKTQQTPYQPQSAQTKDIFFFSGSLWVAQY
jgi:hypothetical protein